MKCDKCGFTTNPGDQVCINCGSKLSLSNLVSDGYKEVNTIINTESEKKTINKKIIIFTSIGVLILILVVVLILKFLVLR